MRTEVNIERSDSPFGYGKGIVFMGSCFSEHIGERLVQRKFDIDLNPFGVLYNPVSIASGIQRLIQREPYREDDLFYHQGWWHSFDHHSTFSNADRQECLDKINHRLNLSSEYLRQSEYLFVTFGTARVFHQKSTGKVVSNCHQVPAREFETQLLRVGDIVRMYSMLIQEIATINRKLKWVFTISPVRHWKNGPEVNQVSKATLLLAVSELKERLSQVGYFPAYEIFMDDLRDYRYYADDMIHPGSQGLEYTWKKFTDTYIDSEALQLMKSVEALIRGKNHRPRNPGSDEYREFLSKQYEMTKKLSDENPDVEFNEFLDFFSPDET